MASDYRGRTALAAMLCLLATGVCGSRVALPPLTEAEALEIAVSASDAVVIATIGATRDSFVVRDSVNGHWVQYLDLSEVSALKGEALPANLRVLVPQYATPTKMIRRSLSRSEGRGIFFLRRSSIRWLLTDAEGIDCSVIPLGTGRKTELPHRVRALAEGQSLESVASEAPIILLGWVRRQWIECTGPHGPSHCMEVVPEEVVAGSLGDSVISINCPRLPRPPQPGRAMFFLRPGPTGAYELVGSQAGIITTEPRYLTAPKVDVPALVRRVLLLRAARQAEGR